MPSYFLRVSWLAYLHWIGVALSCATILFAAYWMALTANHLDRVGVVSAGVRQGSAPSSGWFASNAILALSLLLVTAPRRVCRVDMSAALGGGWLLLCFLAMGWFEAGLDLGYGDRECLRAGCWPRGVQELLVLAPSGIAGLTLLAQAFAPARWPWWLRSVPAVFVLWTTTVAQLAVWPSVVVPFLTESRS